MNKTVSFFLFYFFTVFSFVQLQGESVGNSSEITPIKRTKKRLTKPTRAESAAPILDIQAAQKINDLPKICTPEVKRFEPEPTESDKRLCLFLHKLEFTQDGIATFFSQTFNRKEYATEFLPHSFSHLIQFLRYAQQTDQSQEFVDGVLRLFSTKLKGASFVNASAFEKLLDAVACSCSDLLPHEKLSLWKEIKRLLWTNFKNKFSALKEDPMNFFEDISDQIIQKIKVEVTTPDRLRGTIIRFIGSSIDKVAWSAVDQEQTWKSFTAIAQKISLLYQKGIINDPFDLNELYWGLIERYCFFLELTGSQLTLNTIESIKKSLTTQKLEWLELEEQEQGLETKKHRLIQAIIETEAKIRVAQEGVLTELFTKNSLQKV